MRKIALICLASALLVMIVTPASSAGSNTPGPQLVTDPAPHGAGACPGEVGLWNPGPKNQNYDGGRFVVDAYSHTFNAADSCFQRAQQSLFFAITGAGTPYFELVFFTFPDGVGCFVAYGQGNAYNDNGTNRGCDTPHNLPVTGQYQMRGVHTGSNVWEFSYRRRTSSTATWGAWTIVDSWNTGVNNVKRIFAESSAYVTSDQTLPERSSTFTEVQVRRQVDAVWANANLLCPTDVTGVNIAMDNDPFYAFDRAFAMTVGRGRVVPGSGTCI